MTFFVCRMSRKPLRRIDYIINNAAKEIADKRRCGELLLRPSRKRTVSRKLLFDMVPTQFTHHRHHHHHHNDNNNKRKYLESILNSS